VISMKVKTKVRGGGQPTDRCGNPIPVFQPI
jgi:hypothetical protein